MRIIWISHHERSSVHFHCQVWSQVIAIKTIKTKRFDLVKKQQDIFHLITRIWHEKYTFPPRSCRKSFFVCNKSTLSTRCLVFAKTSTKPYLAHHHHGSLRWISWKSRRPWMKNMKSLFQRTKLFQLYPQDCIDFMLLLNEYKTHLCCLCWFG